MRGEQCSLVPTTALVAKANALGLLRFVDGSPLLDSRGLLGAAEGRALMVDLLAPHIQERGSDVVLGGVANSGSVLGVLLAERLTLDFVNVLVDGPRKRGLRRQLEPEHPLEGRDVVLVDNWVSSGASLLEAARLIRSANGAVAGALTVSASSKFATESFPIPVHLGIPLMWLIK